MFMMCNPIDQSAVCVDLDKPDSFVEEEKEESGLDPITWVT
jgi:hypothetical protein